MESAIMSPIDAEEESILLGAQDDFYSRYERWDKEHSRMRGRPPKQPKGYLKHARNLLPLLAGVSELHPAAKAVVVMFRAVVELQFNRIENDIRVHNMFLTASDMMRGVLEIDIVTKGRGDREIISSNRHLQDRLRRISEDIRECGNAIDTYYKQTKLVKFMKAMDWKDTVAEFNQKFTDHRVALVQSLSIRTALGVDDLLTKMGLLCKSVFVEDDTERKLDQQIRQFGQARDQWIQDSDKVQKLYEIIRTDPLVDSELFDKDEKHGTQGGDSKIKALRLVNHMKLLREEVNADVKTLRARNKDVFIKKIDFQTAQIQESIRNSAEHIVRQLSGPYERLKHDDLRALWKEMNWLFCVDRKVFAMALYEYYLDAFSIPVKTSANGGATSQHNDFWTLDYLLTYAEEICSAVDADASGYIRISEVNVFTDQTPKGWSLPEWCVYHALGWHYEQHLYQKRLLHLLDVFHEAQAFATPRNRYSVQFAISDSLGFIRNLARGPRIRDYAVLPERMLELIRHKVQSESQQYRGHFKTFHGYLDSEDTAKIIYRTRALETYVLQLCIFILEQCLDVAEVCRTETVPWKQWEQLDKTIETVRLMVINRIGYWEVTFRDKRQDIGSAIDSHYGGLFRICVLEDIRSREDAPQLSPWGNVEIEACLEDFHLLSDVSWPPLHRGDPSDVLSFPTWEKLHPDSAIADVQTDKDRSESGKEIEYAAAETAEDDECPPAIEFPFFYGGCDNCKNWPLVKEPHYRCLECDDFDFCQDCFRLPFESLDATTISNAGHLSSHTFLKQALFTPCPVYNRWIKALAEYTVQERFNRAYYKFRPDKALVTGNGDEHSEDVDDSQGEGDANEAGTQVVGWDLICDACQARVRSSSGRHFMACLHPLCNDFDLCQDCAEKNNFHGGPHSEEEYCDNSTPGVFDAHGHGHHDDRRIDDGHEHRGGGKTNADFEVEGPSDDRTNPGHPTSQVRKIQPLVGREGDYDDELNLEVEGPPDGKGKQATDRGDGANPIAIGSANKDKSATSVRHRWWHTMVVVPLVDRDQSEEGQAIAKPLTPPVEAPEDDRIARLEGRMEGMENDISHIKKLLVELLDRVKYPEMYSGRTDERDS